jgi:MFS family permease
VGPFIGPALAGYILDGSHNQWVVSFGVLTALYGVSTLLIIVFGYETFYLDRSASLPYQRSMHTRLRSFFGIGNTHLPKLETLTTQSKVLLKLFFKISLLLPGIATMINFCWPIGITTTVDTFLHSPPYSFDTVQASSMRFAGVIGALSGMFYCDMQMPKEV